MKLKCINYRYNRVGGIDCDVEHPHFGLIPYTLDTDEVRELSNEIDISEFVGDLRSPDTEKL